MLERLYLRPELAMFEQILKRRIEQIQSVEDERIARPRGVERDASTGELVVVAEFVAGSRLSDLLDASSDEAVVPGVDVALSFLIDGLEALSSLHSISRGTHGLIDPSRTIITAEGQVVFVDAAFGAAIERLHLSSERLWNDYGAAGSTAGEPVRFDPTRDVTQVALGALMLVLGRNLRRDEYPDAIPSLLMEVIEVAQIRGSSNFAGSLHKFLQRTLPLPGRRPFASADEALADLRPLVRREIGLESCRRAMIDFVAQMDAAFANTETDTEGDAASQASNVPQSDQFLDSFETVEPAESNNGSGVSFEIDSHDDALRADSHVDLEEDDDSEELELSLEQIDAPAQSARREEPVEEVYDLPALDGLNASHSLGSDLATYEEPEMAATPVVEKTPDPPADYWREEHKAQDAFAAVAAGIDQTPWTEPGFASAAPAIPEVVEQPVADELTAVAESASPAIAEPDPEPDPEKELEKEHESGSSRRRKRQQQKSARARKDKLRSTTTDQKLPPPPPVPIATPPPLPPPPPPRPASPSGWLVSPQRAAASEHLIPEPAPVPTRPVPSMPSFSPSPVGTFAQPTYATPSASTSPYGTPTVIKPAPPAPKPIVVQPPPVVSTPVKIKSEQPVITPKRAPEPISAAPVDRFSTLSLGGASEEPETTRAFPRKLALVALIVAAVAIVLGRSYLPGRSAVPGEAGAQSESGAAASNAAAPVDNSPIPAGKGRISVQTQPPGLRVLLDRKPIGETPLTVDTTPGRHALTFITSGGEVVNNVRVTAGKVTALDIPVYSGWLTLVSPFVLDITESGQSIGSSEESRLMLPPGRHRLTFSNKELGFSQSQDVDIEPGGVKSVTIDPMGHVNLNANPWAEVYLDGVKLGDTPLAGIQVRLGTREFVFKNPQFGEQRITATVRGGRQPQLISHDFDKQ